VADESLEHANVSPESLGGGTVRMVLTVPDPDAMFAKAVAAGAREVVAVAEAYGWRLGRVVDPYGHHWEIGRPLSPKLRRRNATAGPPNNAMQLTRGGWRRVEASSLARSSWSRVRSCAPRS
jgi:hypothetical protein